MKIQIHHTNSNDTKVLLLLFLPKESSLLDRPESRVLLGLKTNSKQGMVLQISSLKPKLPKKPHNRNPNLRPGNDPEET